MVNADRSNNSMEMGGFAMKKQEQNGSVGDSMFSKQTDMGSRVYKLMIRIEKIRPKPCPKSKKSALLTVARRLEQLKAGIPSRIAEEEEEESSVSPKKPAMCSICKAIFQSAQSVYLHKKKQHCHICPICNVECSSKSSLESHIKMHKRIEASLNNPDKPATRSSARAEASQKKLIGQSFERGRELKSSEKVEEKSRKVDGKQTSGSYAGVTFTCRVCSKDFATVEAAEAHTMDHMEVVEEEHKCSICKKLFKSETSLNEHLAEHLSRALRCPVCPKAFINRATLRIHMKSHGQG